MVRSAHRPRMGPIMVAGDQQARDDDLDATSPEAWSVLLHDLRAPAALALGRTQLLRRHLAPDARSDPARIEGDLTAIETALRRIVTRLEQSGTFIEAGTRRRFLGGRLAVARQRAGLSQRALAQAAGLSHGTVARLERGEGQMPRLPTLHRMARVLGVAPETLVAWEPDPGWAEEGD